MARSESTSASLLDRLRDPNDEEAKERFVQFCGPFVYAFSRKLRIPEAKRFDFTQDIFLLLFQQMPKFVYKREMRFRGWLFTVMRNKHQEQFRRERTFDPVPVSDLADDREVPDIETEEFNRHVIQRALQIMRNDFEQRTWQACWELVVNEKSGKEVSAQLGMSVAAVYKARCKVLHRLREELAGFIEDEK